MGCRKPPTIYPKYSFACTREQQPRDLLIHSVNILQKHSPGVGSYTKKQRKINSLFICCINIWYRVQKAYPFRRNLKVVTLLSTAYIGGCIQNANSHRRQTNVNRHVSDQCVTPAGICCRWSAFVLNRVCQVEECLRSVVSSSGDCLHWFPSVVVM